MHTTSTRTLLCNCSLIDYEFQINIMLIIVIDYHLYTQGLYSLRIIQRNPIAYKTTVYLFVYPPDRTTVLMSN